MSWQSLNCALSCAGNKYGVRTIFMFVGCRTERKLGPSAQPNGVQAPFLRISISVRLHNQRDVSETVSDNKRH